MVSTQFAAVAAGKDHSSLEALIEDVSTVTEVVTQDRGSSALMDFFTTIDLAGFISRIFEALLWALKNFVMAL